MLKEQTKNATRCRAGWLWLFLALSVVPLMAEEPVYLRDGEQDYQLTYEAYDPPKVVDMTVSSPSRKTPWQTLQGYYQTMAAMTDYAQLEPYLRKANGEAGEPPQDKAAFISAAKEILSGKVTVHGFYTLDEYTIYLYKYEKSIPRISGLPLRKFAGEDFFIVQDLALVNEFVGKMSAARWDIEQLRKRFPGPPPPPRDPSLETVTEVATGEGGGKKWWLLAIVISVVVSILMIVKSMRR